MEQVVRDTKQRFRDTLPKGYLSDKEYELYVRLYGPPLRETDPEDVGIHMHADMGLPEPRPDLETTLLREVDGEYEEVAYKQRQKTTEQGESAGQEEEADVGGSSASGPPMPGHPSLMQKSPNYVESVARNQRELDALQKLSEEFEQTMKEQKEREAQAMRDEVDEESLARVAETTWPAEGEELHLERREEERRRRETGASRFHPYTVAGSFHGNELELSLPRQEFVDPIVDILRRTHLDHVREAAEAAYGGPGLPLSAEMVLGRKSGHMGGVGLLADKRHMTEIEADAFLAGFMPAAYASIMATVREVRKRLGSDWIQSKLKKGGEGLSVLDAGSGGAGLIAWDQILNAEWELLREQREVRGPGPPGRKTVIATSERLRNRLKTFLPDTTFLPRMPDYEHSGEMRGPRLEGSQPQSRKSYDLIIASHLFLREKESHRRQAVLNNLWHLLNKDGGVLIILEKAHPRGFEAVAHARDTILKRFLLTPEGESRVAPEDFNPAYHRDPEPGHIVAPCTNQGTCPMYPEPGKSVGRRDFCHFSQRFVRPNFYNRLLRKKADNHGEVEFSYVAVQRGVARDRGAVTGEEAAARAREGYEHADEAPDMQSLPRLIEPALKRKGHVSMDVCTPAGTIERWTVPKSFSKLAYHDARKSRWGDLWALGAKTRTPRNVRVGTPDDGGKRATSGADRGVPPQQQQQQKQPPKSKKRRQEELLAELREQQEEEDELLGEEIEAELAADEQEPDEPETRRR